MIIDFRSHTPVTWLAEYQKDIRVMVDWKKVLITGCESALLTRGILHAGVTVYYPWSVSETENWMDSTANRTVGLGYQPLIIRAPALFLKDGFYLLLDRCHRIDQLGPAGLILDSIHVTTNSLKYFADLKSPFFQQLISGSSAAENPSTAPRTLDKDRKSSQSRAVLKSPRRTRRA